jgi:hypothetical protein
MPTNATKPSVDSIKVRMYRHGFGDCFLLSYMSKRKRIFSMLIDCGIKLNTRSATVPIETVIDDLKQTLAPASGGKPKIDVLVVTHEHWDHVSFFHPQKFPDFFGSFEIGQVWLGWTENPDDLEAVGINSRLRDGAAALQIAVTQLKKSEAETIAQFQGFYGADEIAKARKRYHQDLEEVLGFFGVSGESPNGIKYKPNGKISVLTEEAMTHVVKLGKKGGIKYCEPGTVVDGRSLPSGVRVYVLGPPRNNLINKSNPSRGTNKETYFSIDQGGYSSFVEGVMQLGSQLKAEPDVSPSIPEGPFGAGFGKLPADVELDPYYVKTYFNKVQAYRKIENSWLDIAGQFALQLDGAVNNTSLVLAIELTDSGKVLLFPGDAQVGSWLSWHEHEWKVKRDGQTETVTAENLLANTVLYKVSHHGSHNATLKAKGLEMMIHHDLVAMIPEKEGSYSGILYEPLIDELDKQCKGRVLVSADANHPPEALLKTRPSGLTQAEWQAFKKAVTVKREYIEIEI